MAEWHRNGSGRYYSGLGEAEREQNGEWWGGVYEILDGTSIAVSTWEGPFRTKREAIAWVENRSSDAL